MSSRTTAGGIIRNGTNRASQTYTIQTRTQTALEQAVPRRWFSHLRYPSESESDQEPIEPPVEEAQQPVFFLNWMT